MTQKIAVHRLKTILLPIKFALTTLLFSSVFTQKSYGQEQEWWFDVEVILFERKLDSVAIAETFKQSQLVQANSEFVDLLTPYLNPDLSFLRAGLPYCRASNRLAVQTQYQQDFAFGLPLDNPNKTSSSQPTDLKRELGEPQQNLDMGTEHLAEERFQYQVATTDIFAQSKGKHSVDSTTNLEDITSSKKELAAETNLQSRPIQVEFIEWQIPSELLCSYAEQIDPSFAAINILPSEELSSLPTHSIKRVPDIIDGVLWHKKHNAFLLPTSNLRMSDLYSKIRKQRDISPLLHLSWRQEVKFGRDKAQTFRLFAGENFANNFDANGLPLVENTDPLFDRLSPSLDENYLPQEVLAQLTPEQQQVFFSGAKDNELKTNPDDLFTKIETALADVTPLNIAQVVDQMEPQSKQPENNINPAILNELWQLDGGITVYLRHVGRVPYLHIDSNLDFRKPVFDPQKAQKIESSSTGLVAQGEIVVNQERPPNYLQSVNFNQLRRVISKQVHYFDHPLFGMIVSINRYRWPVAEMDLNGAESQQN
ncbi:CsiV family protein [uncultured Paraglaciecola sp.]|uniref:CsiV family protein n=1 Tax=uncultured Paraglaciecola sp. TaxID=1765024 RepID=UPI0026233744|nr:CsiV family protein [uncultured Paraglaciecola sp.]